jgi:PASTA domain
VKRLCTAALAATVLALGGGSAAGQENTLTFKQTQGADGLFHIDLGVSYNFPGLPPRTANSGVGTVRVTLPGGVNLQVDPAQPPDPGYTCGPSADGAICSADGQPNGGGGLSFPTSMTVHLVSTACWSPAPGTQASADVWAAPNDPGTAPDVSLPIQGDDCGSYANQQPVLDLKGLKCLVPKLKNVSLVSATRRLNNAKCARGKVKYVGSAKVRKGRVISQSVKPGTVLKEKGKVNLVVSKGRLQ